MPGLIELTGQRFGRLTVVGPSSNAQTCAQRLWAVVCDCGERRDVQGSNLRGGSTASCGCLAREVFSKTAARTNYRHGMTYSPEWRTWSSMLTRCNNEKSKCYRYYGAKGVSICERWRSFENFVADVGPRPAGTTLDRIDNSRGYEPENCRWATIDVQNRNRGSILMVEINGETKCVADWCDQLGIPRPRVYARIQSGMALYEAITKPVNQAMVRERRSA